MNDLNIGERLYVGTWGQRIHGWNLVAPPGNQGAKRRKQTSTYGSWI